MLRVAFMGKGGAGKSSLAGTVARLLGRSGRPVLAIDSDPLPGLAYSLGVDVVDMPIPDDVVVEGPEGGPRWVLRPGLDPLTFIDRFAPVGADGVRYLQFGNLWGHITQIQRAQHAWSQVVRDLPADIYDIIGDLPGGTRQPMFGWAKYADIGVIVVEPTVKSLHSARRLLNISQASWAPPTVHLVANKVRTNEDIARIEARLGKTVVASTPWSEEILEAERQRIAPLDIQPEPSFVAGARSLVDALDVTYGLDQEVSP